MPDVGGTLAVLAVAMWADEDEGKRICLETIDNYVVATRGSASDKFQALEELRRMAGTPVNGMDHAEWVANAIDVRLAELMASMVGAGVPSVPSALLES